MKYTAGTAILTAAACCWLSGVSAWPEPRSGYYGYHSSPWRKTGHCCLALSHALGNKTVVPGSSPYNESLASYWSVQEENVYPNCVVLPESAEDVSIAVSVLGGSGGYDRTGRWHSPGEGCQFAVRSGGHTPWAGAANIEEGVTIDLSNLNQVTVSPNRSTVTIGPGNSWYDVYDVVVPQGLATGGGRVAIVGVGGLVLGGGVSFFSPRKGFVCDMVERFEVVLASGEIVQATSDSHRDLWLALKGGSNNFGVVTAIEQRVFEQGDFWGGFIGFDESTFPAQFEAFEALTGSPDYDPYASLIHNLVFNTTTRAWSAASNFEYTKPEAYPPFFDNFTSLPTTFNTTRISNLTDFTVELSASNPIGRRQLFVTGTYGNSAKMLEAIYLISNQTVHEMDAVPNLAFSLSFQPEPTIIQAASAAAGGNSLGLSVEDGPLFNFLLTMTWDTEADDEFVNQQGRDLYNQAEQKASELGVQKKYIYLNYAAPWQEPIKGYGEEIVAQLQAVSRKYDPEGVFQKLVPGGFKLFD